MNEIEQNVLEHLKRHADTQRGLAEELGYSQAHISRTLTHLIETGKLKKDVMHFGDMGRPKYVYRRKTLIDKILGK